MPGTEQLTNGMLGNYRIERLLGQSQLGAAYLALEPERSIRVMVTTFAFPEGQTAQERDQIRVRFATEGEALVRLRHAAIVPIYAFGELPDALYQMAAFVKQPSLGQILKQNTRLEPWQALHILKQLAAGLDYAHSRGMVHGMLSLANVVVNSDHEVGIAGFGLRTMLEMHGSLQDTRPLAHLSSSQGAFLGSPEYIAPERMLRHVRDPREDIYALGVMLFALLSGIQPFRAATPLDIALQRLLQPVPQVSAVCPTVPEACDLVIARALEREPARRFQSAGELVEAFERVVKTGAIAQQANNGPGDSPSAPSMPDLQLTMPPTVDWFDDQVTPSGRWQVVQPIGTARMRALNASPNPLASASAHAASPNDTELTRSSNVLPTVTPSLAAQAPSASPLPGSRADVPDNAEKTNARNNRPVVGSTRSASNASLAGIDPFAWWSSRAGGRKPTPTEPPAASRRIALRPSSSASQVRRQPDQRGRRRVVTLAVAGVAAVGALTVGGISFAHLTQSAHQAALASKAPTTPASPAPTVRATSTRPAQRPAATPTRQPGHSGTVIGSTTLAANSARLFTNPADGVSSLLIHLANGKFVACERTCTHQGVLVNYDPQSKMLVCPAHGAVFNPMTGFSHVSGPGQGPLPPLTVRVNGDGTVTTG